MGGGFFGTLGGAFGAVGDFLFGGDDGPKDPPPSTVASQPVDPEPGIVASVLDRITQFGADLLDSATKALGRGVGNVLGGVSEPINSVVSTTGIALAVAGAAGIAAYVIIRRAS